MLLDFGEAGFRELEKDIGGEFTRSDLGFAKRLEDVSEGHRLDIGTRKA